MWESEKEGKRRNGPHTVSTLWTRVHEEDKQSRAQTSEVSVHQEYYGSTQVQTLN